MKAVDIAIGLFVGMLMWFFLYHIGIVKGLKNPGWYGLMIAVVSGILAYYAVKRELQDEKQDEEDWRGL